MQHPTQDQPEHQDAQRESDRKEFHVPPLTQTTSTHDGDGVGVAGFVGCGFGLGDGRDDGERVACGDACLVRRGSATTGTAPRRITCCRNAITSLSFRATSSRNCLTSSDVFESSSTTARPRSYTVSMMATPASTAKIVSVAITQRCILRRRIRGLHHV